MLVAPVLGVIGKGRAPARSHPLATYRIHRCKLAAACFQRIKLRSGLDVVKKVDCLATRRQVRHARQDHIHAMGGQGIHHLVEAGLFPLQFHTHLRSQRYAEIDVEAGQFIGCRVLVFERRIVRHDGGRERALARDRRLGMSHRCGKRNCAEHESNKGSPEQGIDHGKSPEHEVDGRLNCGAMRFLHVRKAQPR